MIVGEKMSGVISDPASVFEGSDGQLYADFYSHRMGTPLHTAPTLYVRLRKIAGDFAQVEVYQDHARDVLTITISRDEHFYRRQIQTETIVTRRVSTKTLAEDLYNEFMLEESRVS